MTDHTGISIKELSGRESRPEVLLNRDIFSVNQIVLAPRFDCTVPESLSPLIGRVITPAWQMRESKLKEVKYLCIII